MDSVSRYITIKAINFENTLIPIWDKEIEFEKTEDHGEIIRYKHNICHQLVDCIYDFKKRTLSPGIEIDIYPEEGKNGLKKGIPCFYEKSHHQLEEVTIIDIIFESFDITILKGKKMDKWYKQTIQKFYHNTINPNDIYCIKSWIPTYVLSNNVLTEYTHELYLRYETN
jgi:hypothetical protein